MLRKAIHVVAFVIGSVACLLGTILTYAYSLVNFVILPIAHWNKDVWRAFLWAVMPLLKLYGATNRHLDDAVKDIEREAEP